MYFKSLIFAITKVESSSYFTWIPSFFSFSRTMLSNSSQVGELLDNKMFRDGVLLDSPPPMSPLKACLIESNTEEHLTCNLVGKTLALSNFPEYDDDTPQQFRTLYIMINVDSTSWLLVLNSS